MFLNLHTTVKQHNLLLHQYRFYLENDTIKESIYDTALQ